MGLPLFIRAWIVVSGLIGIGTGFFFFILREKKSFYWGFLVFAVISSMYLLPSFLMFACALFFLIQFFIPRSSKISRVSYGLFLLPLAPAGSSYTVPFPGLQQLLTLTYPRLLSLFLFFPIFLDFLLNRKRKIVILKYDKYALLFFLYIFLIRFRDTTFTDALRNGVNIFLDFFLLYFAISRSIDEIEDFVRLFRLMIFSAFILALIGIFECLKRWILYEALFGGTIEGKGVFELARAGWFRGSASFGPIPLGAYFVVMTAILLSFMYLKPDEPKKRFIFGVFFVALMCTLSRGPLVGYALFIAGFAFLTLRKTFKIIPLFLALIAIFSITDLGRSITATLPFIGKREQTTIDYRKRLWEGSLPVIKRSPLTGRSDYLEEPEMKELIAPHLGFVDMVNTYLGIALEYGSIGLTLFLLLFIHSLYNLAKVFSEHSNKEIVMFGKILFLSILSYMAIIFTVSPGSFMYFYMWILLALSAAYSIAFGRIVRLENHSSYA